ncbi:hypothetical protein J2854_001675 [Agrobacterium tumefaciens]|nr:hypothetical protein [Agrobacterium tumefaciens]
METGTAATMTVAIGVIGENRETGARIVGSGAANSHASRSRKAATASYVRTYCIETLTNRR